jgi:hypothetical protein
MVFCGVWQCVRGPIRRRFRKPRKQKGEALRKRPALFANGQRSGVGGFCAGLRRRSAERMAQYRDFEIAARQPMRDRPGANSISVGQA